MAKTALVVDDSKTARVVLQEMLETHDLDVVSAESAEDALEFLGEFRPDIIFMDHEMPGMDGLQAVSAIKNNPATATIPIMMYTAQQGEVYVGQARALGAVGVLPKQLEPVEVSKVLESLRIIGEDDARSAQTDSGTYPSLENFDEDLKVLIRDLFDQQRTILRKDLHASHEKIAARAALLPGPMQIVVGVLAVIAMVFAWLYWRSEASWQDMQQQYVDLQRAYDERQVPVAPNGIESGQQLVDLRQSMEVATNVALESLEWGANQSSQYGIDELPMGDFRLSIIERLTDHLMALEFRGLVRIESHVGNFCLSFAGPGGYAVAAPDLPVTRCDRVGSEPGEAYELGLRQSVAFANFINRASERTTGAIRFEIISFGNSSPLLDYPLATAGVTASAWNEIAASNNRVDISLFPEQE